LDIQSKEEEAASTPVASRSLSDFWTSDTARTGQVDLPALKAFLGEVDTGPKTVLSVYDRGLCVFVMHRAQEAQMVQAFNCFPDNVPWNRQPWWLVDLWRCYWSAESSGRDSG